MLQWKKGLLCRRQVGAYLAEGLFALDFPVPEGEHVNAVGFDPAAVDDSAGEGPLGNTEVALHEVLAIEPLCIRHRLPGSRKGTTHCFGTDVTGAAGIWASSCFKYAVVGHERHQGIDVVLIPGGAEGNEGGFGNGGWICGQGELRAVEC